MQWIFLDNLSPAPLGAMLDDKTSSNADQAPPGYRRGLICFFIPEGIWAVLTTRYCFAHHVCDYCTLNGRIIS